MPSRPLTTLAFWRDVTSVPPNFSHLDEILEDIKIKRSVGVIPSDDIDAIRIESPLMLGETYEQIVSNLDKISEAGVMLLIDPIKYRKK